MAYSRFQKITIWSLILVLLSTFVSADLIQVDAQGNPINQGTLSPTQLRSIVHDEVNADGEATRTNNAAYFEEAKARFNDAFEYVKGLKTTIILALVSTVIFALFLKDVFAYLIYRKKRQLEARLYEKRVADRIAIMEKNVAETYRYIVDEQRRNNLSIEAKIQRMMETPKNLGLSEKNASASAVPQKAQAKAKVINPPTEGQLKARQLARERMIRINAEKKAREQQAQQQPSVA